MKAARVRRTRNFPPTLPPTRFAPRFLLSLLLLLLLLSCTGAPPEILRVFWQLNLVEDREQNLSYQTLSLFIKPNDPDGFEDIEDIYLINDEQELFWRLDTESWAQSGSDQDVWIGSNSLKMPDGASFPAGEYRILLRDVGGDSAEQTIGLQLVSSREASRYLPKVTIGNREIQVIGEAPSYQLWVYDTNGSYIASFPASENPVTIATIIKTQPALQGGFRFKVYGFVENRNLGVTSGPYYTKP
ncbi:MAG: hypothetical protein JSV89_09530 [Spirochaetaceae bacterium]|nr:MAG: hypothetical protein JSV89_09530 [Spirochaetaceae bacterium]